MTARQILAQAPDLLTEREFSSVIVDVARLAGWRRYHTFDSRRSNHGFPDWVFVKNGRLLFVELKSEQGKLREEQRLWIDALQLVGIKAENVEVYLWRPSDFDAAVEVLTGKKQRARGPREEQAA